MYAPPLAAGNIGLGCQGGVSIPGVTGEVQAPFATLRQDYALRCGTLYHVRAAGCVQRTRCDAGRRLASSRAPPAGSPAGRRHVPRRPPCMLGWRPQ